MSLLTTMKKRSAMQANATLETQNGLISGVINDQYGNTVAYNVQADGQKKALIGLENASGAKLGAGMTVKLNATKGNPFRPQVIGASGSAAGSVAAATIGDTGSLPP